MNNRQILTVIAALWLATSLFFSDMTSANDGREFHEIRPANNPQGRLLSAADIVNNPSLNPKRSSRYFKTEKAAFPKLRSIKGSIYLLNSAQDSVLLARAEDGIAYGEVVSRHEFGISKGIFPSPDGKAAAFYKKDESRVADFPLLNIAGKSPSLRSVKYPMNGGPSEIISVGVCELSSGKIIYLDTEGEFDNEKYLTNLSWSPDSKDIFIQVLDRAQQNMHLNRYSAESGAFVETILTEHSDTWVEPQHPLEWLKTHTDKAIYSTDNRDGHWNLYLVDIKTKKVKRLTVVDADVQYVANDGSFVYFTAPDFHPVNNYLWKVNVKTGKISQLTTEVGWHSIQMAPDCKSYVDVYEALDKAPVSTLKSIDGKVQKQIYASKDPTSDWAYCEIDLGTVTSADGHNLNYYRMVKPLNFDPSKKYPLILYVYGGPHSQLVKNNFLGNLRRWEMYMAQKGFVVFTMDNRGTLNHGAEYEHCIYRQCGKAAMDDQMLAVNMLKDIPWIDHTRIGVYGWSFGGFMSLTLSSNHPEIFKVAVAGGPVIDWRWYEVMYGERYMSTVAKNPDGFEKSSLMNKAGDIKARTLVIQGAMDDTVLPYNALSFIQKCIDSNTKIDYFTYPKAAHNMRSGDRVHLVNLVADYFIENL